MGMFDNIGANEALAGALVYDKVKSLVQRYETRIEQLERKVRELEARIYQLE